MATHTTNYNLEKPEASDPFGDFRQSYNDNLDIIDQNLGGGGGGHTIIDPNGSDMTQRAGLQFTGSCSVTDDAVNDKTVINISGGGGSFLLVITADPNKTVTATKDGTTLTATEVSTGIYEVEVTSSGVWTLSDGTNTATANVGVYNGELFRTPEGSTVTPTDDVSIWLACGGRTENYTTVAEVLSDSTCLLALLSNDNANDYLVRSTTWANTITADSSAMIDIGLNNYASNTLLSDNTWLTAICNSTYFESVLNVSVPTMTSNTTPEGVAFASSEFTTTKAYNAFDKSLSREWHSTANMPQYLGYEFPQAERILKVVLTTSTVGGPRVSKIQGSNDGSTWTDIGDFANCTATLTPYSVVYANQNSYKYYRLYATQSNYYSGNPYLTFVELQFYGRKDI